MLDKIPMVGTDAPSAMRGRTPAEGSAYKGMSERVVVASISLQVFGDLAARSSP